MKQDADATSEASEVTRALANGWSVISDTETGVRIRHESGKEYWIPSDPWRSREEAMRDAVIIANSPSPSVVELRFKDEEDLVSESYEEKLLSNSLWKVRKKLREARND